MDLSKLPRLSNTPTPPPPPAATPEAIPLAYEVTPRGTHLADVWISAILGLILVCMGLNFGKYVFDKIAHQPYHTNVNWTAGPNEGAEVDYWELSGHTAWTDAGIFLFGLVVLLEAPVIIFSQLKPSRVGRAMIVVALLVTASATLLNVVVSAMLLKDGLVPLLSGLAVAFGGYIAFSLWTRFMARPARLVTPPVG